MNSLTRKITVLLVDDHTVVRQGLRALLNAERDIEVIGEAENGRKAIQLGKQTLPDVVLMDVAMPLLNGFEATRQVLKAAPATKVLVLSSYGDAESARQMLEAGATGYVLKHTAANELVRAIREVHAGKRFLSPAIARCLQEQRHTAFSSGRSAPGTAKPTTREMEVLQLIAESLCNKQIASELGISVKTVEKHRQGLMDKLNLHDTAGLTRYALSRGIVEANPAAIGSQDRRTLSTTEANTGSSCGRMNALTTQERPRLWSAPRQQRPAPQLRDPRQGA